MLCGHRSGVSDGLFTIEVGIASDGEWVDLRTDKALPAEVVAAIKRAMDMAGSIAIFGDICIPFVSHWSHEPTSFELPADDSDDRSLNTPAWFLANQQRYYFGNCDSAMLFCLYEDEIQETEISH